MRCLDIRSNNRPIYRVTADALVKSNISSLIDIALYINSATYNDKNQAKDFSSQKPSKFLNKGVANQLQMALTKRLKNWA